MEKISAAIQKKIPRIENHFKAGAPDSGAIGGRGW
jgi:hypothetical protein